MIERRKNLTLIAESADDMVRIHAAFDQLDGNSLAKLAVGALGKKDRTHSAAAEFALQFINADLCSDHDYMNDFR
jgi:hypothetical protein